MVPVDPAVAGVVGGSETQTCKYIHIEGLSTIYNCTSSGFLINESFQQ